MTGQSPSCLGISSPGAQDRPGASCGRRQQGARPANQADCELKSRAAVTLGLLRQVAESTDQFSTGPGSSLTTGSMRFSWNACNGKSGPDGIPVGAAAFFTVRGLNYSIRARTGVICRLHITPVLCDVSTLMNPLLAAAGLFRLFRDDEGDLPGAVQGESSVDGEIIAGRSPVPHRQGGEIWLGGELQRDLISCKPLGG